MSKKNTPVYFLVPKGLSPKYIQVTLHVLNRLCLGKKTYMHIITTDKNRSYEFKGKQRRIYGKVRREDRDGINIIKVQSQNKIQNFKIITKRLKFST